MAPEGSSTLSFPGPGAPGLAAFELDIPPGFEPIEQAGCLGGARLPLERFMPNVFVGFDRVDAQLELANIARAALDDAAARFEQLQLVDERVEDIAGGKAPLRVTAFSSPATPDRLTQTTAYIWAPQRDGARTRDLFTVTCTCTEDQHPEWGDAFVDVIRSFRFTGA